MRSPSAIGNHPKVRLVEVGHDGLAAIVRIHGGVRAQCIASWGAGWEHVSVSIFFGKTARMPTWDEMSFIKQVFWKPDEWAIEYHPPLKENINHAPMTLHLWRPLETPLPVPKWWMVGPRKDPQE